MLSEVMAKCFTVILGDVFQRVVGLVDDSFWGIKKPALVLRTGLWDEKKGSTRTVPVLHVLPCVASVLRLVVEL